MRGIIILYIVLLNLSLITACGSPSDPGKEGLKAYENKDYETAVKLLLPLAENGNANAQYYMGLMHWSGKGVSKSLVEAREWYLMSAKQGHNVAQFDLGLMYSEGDGVKKDEEEALKWYLLSANRSYAPAQYNAALIYGNENAPHDLVQSYKWLIIAAHTAKQKKWNSMYKQANKVIVSAKKILTPEQITKSTKLAERWIEISN